MGPNQRGEVLSQAILVVVNSSPRQWDIDSISVDHIQIIHVDEVETFADGSVWLMCRLGLLVHPLEVKYTRLYSQLMQHKLSPDQSNRRLSLAFDLTCSDLNLMFLKRLLMSLGRVVIRRLFTELQAYRGAFPLHKVH